MDSNKPENLLGEKLTRLHGHTRQLEQDTKEIIEVIGYVESGNCDLGDLFHLKNSFVKKHFLLKGGVGKIKGDGDSPTTPDSE